ncbi:MAG: DnaD domain protein [Bacilli bacterium]|nr:DnaD domain protein [Bacilli bacterium]
MKIVESNSYFSLIKDFSLSESDHKVLSFLYLPILKGEAFSLYRIFYDYTSLQNSLGGFIHQDFLSMINMSDASFLLARSKLEAIGLLETYRKEEYDQEHRSKVTYIYKLVAPASPKKFFEDVLLRALLLDEVGQKRYHFLSGYFKTISKDLTGFSNITTPFKEVFIPQVKDGDVSLEPVMDVLEDKSYKPQSRFDKAKLKKILKQNQYPVSRLEKYMPQIQNAAVLYDIDEEHIYELIEKNTDSDGDFYLEQFIQDIRSYRQFAKPNNSSKKEDVAFGNEEIAKLVQAFNDCTPEEYLYLRFNAKPAKYMLQEIEELKNNLGFENNMINLILHYSLSKTNMEFNKNFIDKVAYTLSGKNVSDVYSAMVMLTSRDFEVSNKRRSSKKKKEEVVEQEDSSTQEELKDALEGLNIL